MSTSERERLKALEREVKGLRRANEILNETINGLYRAELIHRRAPWKTREFVELATREWIACSTIIG